jgi:hypothetical protein
MINITKKLGFDICDQKGHNMKKCWYYDSNKTMEQNKKEAGEKIKAKQ